MKKKIGFIGCGNMAQAMIAGMIRSEVIPPEQIMASAFTEATLIEVRKNYHIHISQDNKAVAAFADILFLAIKPDQYKKVINEIKDAVGDDTIVVTIAAGITIDAMNEALREGAKVVRTMPNTPSLVGEGLSALCPNEFVEKEELQDVKVLFESFGKAEVIQEDLMDAIPAISGSSPAYVFMFIEALADGGVMQGIPRKQAYRLAAQAVLGAAKMVLETGMHPGELKDQVCSPGGATIEAVTTLEQKQFRGAVLSAMESCTKKAKDLAKS
ncbi:pyrroline-5-carboxylate reductase [Falsibacillus albus]|uniref:Pyrroline-5-carboxylate reductase n=1 Tax=Falsibacillus albus TaxID=2478915 RepID=A0A3L7K3F9_9BACI|nr:pyrroline-5-carboxylate reductase [Falsibacillus albus]RLQ97548.1 pyrroline-5-carboxylate reductase [Falsibacillus albus]